MNTPATGESDGGERNSRGTAPLQLSSSEASNLIPMPSESV
jgi:hypothetical protein